MPLLAIVLTGLNLALFASLGLRRFPDPAERWGYVLAPLLFALLMVALFQVGKRFRNPRSRLRIYCWTLFVFALSGLSKVLNYVDAG